MQMYKSFFKFFMLLSFLGIMSKSYSIDAETMYANNPLRKQMMCAPDRDTVYLNKQDGKKNQEKKSGACVFCMLFEDGLSHDQQNLVITRFKYCTLIMNLYPYHKGHMLLIPQSHVGDLSDVSPEARVEIITILSYAKSIVKEALGAEGVNIGMNIGKIAGASKPDHLHIHIIPRYEIEPISFIHLVCETQFVGYNMQEVYKKLKIAFDELKDELYGV